MKEKALIMDESAVSRAVARISYEILEANKGAAEVCLIGIVSRGRELALRIASKIKEVEQVEVPTGFIDITPFRDDHKETSTDSSHIPFPVEGMRVVLVDDVIYTGRSVRAAMDGVLFRGRPKSIQLAVLVDRGHRELPIRADYVGKNLPTSSDEEILVSLKETDGTDKVSIFQKVMVKE